MLSEQEGTDDRCHNLPNAEYGNEIIEEISLKSPPGRLRTRTPASTSRVPASFFEPLLGAQAKLMVELGAGIFPVNEIAESASYASFAAI
jgi:hypothetical protein